MLLLFCVLQETDIVYATEKQKIFAVETEIEKIENKLNKEKDEIVTIDGNITSLIESMEEKVFKAELMRKGNKNG